MEQLCQNEPIQQEDTAPLGPWIKSNQYGRRVMEEKDRKFYSNPSLSKTFGHYSPLIPDSMLAEMAAMKIQEEREDEGSTSSNNQQQKTRATQTGDGRGGWHRTRRVTDSTSQLMEVTSNTDDTLAKRQRIDAKCREITENQMAGPAGQASRKL
jgi:hypothetical protein